MEKQKIIDKLESYVRDVTRFLFQWLSEEGDVLGYVLAIVHTLGTVAIWLCIVLSHTIYIDTWFQIFTFIVLFICWLQHIFLDVCVSFFRRSRHTKAFCVAVSRVPSRFTGF